MYTIDDPVIREAMPQEVAFTEELARTYPITVYEAWPLQYFAPQSVVRDTCRLLAFGFTYPQIRHALIFGEANTAFGFAWWISTRVLHLTPARIERMPWYRQLKEEAL